MNDFVYNNPVKIIFGRHALAQVGEEASKYGKKALLVCGKSSLKANDTFSLISETLEKSGVQIIEHSGVKPNPVVSFVHEGITKAREHNCSMVIGAGGGSVMDTAKAVASGIKASHDVWKFFTGKKTVRDTLPVITIPTCAGTGSEINNGMVLTHDRKQLKLGFAHRRLFPRVCIADPSLAFSVTDPQSVYGAIDTFVHCLEPYLSAAPPYPPLQFRQLETIMKTVVETIKKIRLLPLSYEDRATLLWCGSFAMSGFCTAGMGRINFPLHVLEHAVSVSGNIAHGAGLSALMPGWLRACRDSLDDRLCRLGNSVFRSSDDYASCTASAAIHRLTVFLSSIGCPVCLEEIGIEERDFPAIIEHALYQAKIWRFRDYDERHLLTLLHACLHPHPAE